MAIPVQYFQKLVESCPDIIIAVDNQGTITFYNDGARQNLDFSPEEVLGKDILKIYPTLDEARKVMAAMRSDGYGGRGRVSNFETIFKTRKGETIPVAISASILYDDDGRETGSIGFAKDIREIRRRDQLVTLAEIAIGLSHEVNNSLEVLVNHIELFQKYVERAATDEDYIVEIERLESIATEVKKIQATTGRISKMAEEGQYGTKEYLAGRLMTDLRVGDARGKGQRLKPDDQRPLTGLRVLVVDDDLAVCRSLTDLLGAEGCKVETAHSGVQGMERVWAREFDVVLSDVVMPDMNGFELYKKVKKHAPHLPVVLMTAFNYDKDHVIKHSCLDGLQGVIFKKPVNPALLKKTLLQQCRSKDSWGKSPVRSQPDSPSVDNPKTH